MRFHPFENKDCYEKAAIAGIVVALGAVWTGSAWYTGKKAETFVKQLIQDGNVDLQKFGERTGVTPSIELISFERGVFSSTERYRVKFSIPARTASPAMTARSSSSNTWTTVPSRCRT